MTKRRVKFWVLLLASGLFALSACDQPQIAASTTAETPTLGDGQPALRALPVETAAEGQADPTEAVNLPVVITDEQGQAVPTLTVTSAATLVATPTAGNLTPPPTILPSATPSASATATMAPTDTPTSFPAVTATVGPIETTTPVASDTPGPSPTPTKTPQGQTTPATATMQPSATPTVAGSGQHFADCVSSTGNNATIAVPNDTQISGGLTLAAGDEVAVFTPDGQICAGVEVWLGQNIAITVWGDDSQTPQQDGLQTGDVMRFHIWDASESVQYEATEVTYSTGNGIFSPDSIHVLNSMTVSNS